MTSASRHSRSLFLVLALLVALSAVGTWSPPLHAGSTATVRAITASPTKILADGGESTVQVTVGGDVTPETRLTLTTTLGAFGTSQRAQPHQRGSAANRRLRSRGDGDARR